MGSILLRRGPKVDRLLFTPLSGELIFDTTEKKIYVGDGLTPGGLKISSDIVLENGNLFNIPNSSLENSTISGVSLGNNLFNLTAGNFLSGGPYNGGSAVTLSVNASSTNSTNNIVARDSLGNFSATTITASLNGNAATVTNGIYTNQSYSNPSWLASLSETKVLPSQDTKTGKYLRTNGTNTYWDEVYPSQIGNSGKFLTTNGSSVGWASAGTIGFPSIVGNDQKYLKVNGTDIVWEFVTSAANGQLSLGVSGNGLSGSQTFTANQSSNVTFTVSSNATSINDPSTIVFRDINGDFSAGNINATTITSDLFGSVFGSVFANDSSIIVDADTSTIFGNLVGNASTVTNGVVTTGSYANPSWITALSLSQGGTGGNSQVTALTNLLPTGEALGYVLKTNGRGTYFWSAETGASGTQGNTISTVRSTVTATANQTVFTTTEYVVGAGQLRVYIDGVRQYPSEYTETSTTSFTLTTGVPAGTLVFIEVDAFVGQNITASTIINAPSGDISATDVQNAINELDQEKAPKSNPSFTGIVTFGSYASIQTLLEKATITAAAPTATTQFDVISQAVQFYTANSANSFILNLRGNSTTTLNSILSVGQSVSIAVFVTCSNSTHYLTAVNIDGTTTNVTTRWQGAFTPTSGNASSVDIYTVTVVKTAATPAYSVFATQTRFG